MVADGHLPALPGDGNLPNSEVVLAAGRIAAFAPGVSGAAQAVESHDASW